MKEVSFTQKIRQAGPLTGMIMTLPEPALPQIAARSGFDWLFIDGEHSNLDYAGVETILAATPPDCYGIVRVPKLDEIWTKKVLDSGAEGVIFPQINTPEEAKRAVGFCNYPPDGDRSTGIGRAHDYGFSFGDYLGRANTDIAVIIQVEQKEGADRIKEIVDVDGIDALFIGPYDLSASLGVTGEVDHPVVLKAISDIRAAAKSKNLPVGIFAMDAKKAKAYIDEGFEYVAVGVDFLYFSEAAQNTIRVLKNG